MICKPVFLIDIPFITCLLQKSKTEAVRASFDIGELETDGTVKLTSYKWDIDQKNWFADPPYDRDYRSLYDFPKINDNSKEKKHIKLVENPFTIVGYTLLGSLGCDGIKYYWKKDDKYVESIAFNRRLRNLKIKEDADISAYTISTSFGCVLSATEQQCRFCETGTLKFGGHLRAEDIALQCIFMAEYDSGEIVIDPKELLEANWYRYDDLPLLPPPGTVACRLIEDTVAMCRAEYE